jgi:hypothetical protein
MKVSVTVSRTLVTLSFVALAVVGVVSAQGQSTQIGPLVIYEDHHDTSPPVRELASMVPKSYLTNHVVAPLHRRPGPPIIGSKLIPWFSRLSFRRWALPTG